MPNWIETEDKQHLINVNQIVDIDIEPGVDIEPDDAYAKSGDSKLRLTATFADDGYRTLIRGLTISEAHAAMQHLSLWLPSTTPRTIRMSELAKSVKGEPERSASGTRRLDENGEAR